MRSLGTLSNEFVRPVSSTRGSRSPLSPQISLLAPSISTEDGGKFAKNGEELVENEDKMSFTSIANLESTSSETFRKRVTVGRADSLEEGNCREMCSPRRAFGLESEACVRLERTILVQYQLDENSSNILTGL